MTTCALPPIRSTSPAPRIGRSRLRRKRRNSRLGRVGFTTGVAEGRGSGSEEGSNTDFGCQTFDLVAPGKAESVQD